MNDCILSHVSAKRESLVVVKGKDADAPTGISPDLWDKVKSNDHHNKHKWKEDFAEFAGYTQPPPGFNDASLWMAMDLDQKDVFLQAAKELRPKKTYESHVLAFFFDYEADDFNFDAGVSAFALLNALVLTIPYTG